MTSIIYKFIVWYVTSFLGKFFLNLKVKGKENFKSIIPRNVIFASNHQSYFDAFLVSGAAIPWPYHLKNKGVKYLTYFKFITEKWYGPIIFSMGAYPVYPGQGDIKKSTKSTIDFLNKGFDIVIFPLGKKTTKIIPEEAKQGLGYIAKQTNSQIVPVRIDGTDRISLREFLFRKRQVTITFGQPIRYADLAEENDQPIDVSKKIMARVRDL